MRSSALPFPNALGEEGDAGTVAVVHHPGDSASFGRSLSYFHIPFHGFSLWGPRKKTLSGY